MQSADQQNSRNFYESIIQNDENKNSRQSNNNIPFSLQPNRLSKQSEFDQENIDINNIPTHLKNCELKFVEFLISNYSKVFSNKKNMIPYYSKIDNEQHKRKHAEFWLKDVIPNYLENYTNSCQFTVEQITKQFTIDKKVPLGIAIIIRDNIETKDKSRRQVFNVNEEQDLIVQKLGLQSSFIKNNQKNSNSNNSNKSSNKISQIKKNNNNSNLQEKKESKGFFSIFNPFKYLFGSQVEVNSSSNQKQKLMEETILEGDFVYFPELQKKFNIYEQKVWQIFEKEFEDSQQDILVYGERDFDKKMLQFFNTVNMKKDLQLLKNVLINSGQIELRDINQQDDVMHKEVRNMGSFKVEDKIIIVSRNQQNGYDEEDEQKIQDYIGNWKINYYEDYFLQQENEMENKMNETQKTIDDLENKIKELILQGKKTQAQYQLGIKQMHEKYLNNLQNQTKGLQKLRLALTQKAQESKLIGTFQAGQQYLGQFKDVKEQLQEITLAQQELENEESEIGQIWQNMNENSLYREAEAEYEQFEQQVNQQQNVNNIQQNQNQNQQEILQNNNNLYLQQQQQQQQQNQQQQNEQEKQKQKNEQLLEDMLA